MTTVPQKDADIGIQLYLINSNSMLSMLRNAYSCIDPDSHSPPALGLASRE